MFIQTEPTPNPATLKFLPGRRVMTKGTADYPTVDTADNSPLARRLFAVDGVIAVFLGHDFVTVTKRGGLEWPEIKPLVLAAIMDHFNSGEPVVSGETEEAAGEEDDKLVAQIKDLLDTRVRPQVARDGGDIVYRDFRDGVVYLKMQGSCAGCPSSTATLKHGIENMLKYYVPEVVSVQAVND